MGTSTMSRGMPGTVPLVPSWLGGPEPAPAPKDAARPAAADPNVADEQVVDPAASAPIPLVVAPLAGRFSASKSNLTRFSGGGGRNGAQVGRAIRSYVRSGNRGGTNAARRMGSATRSAATLLGVLQRFERDGVAATLQSLNIDAALAGDPQAALVALTDLICADGGLVDEAIGREAWVETVAELDRLGILDIENFDPEQKQTVFSTFIAKTIEGRILLDVGERGFKFAGSVDDINIAHKNVFEHIVAAVGGMIRDTFPRDLSSASPETLTGISERVYTSAWDLLESYGEES